MKFSIAFIFQAFSTLQKVCPSSIYYFLQEPLEESNMIMYVSMEFPRLHGTQKIRLGVICQDYFDSQTLCKSFNWNVHLQALLIIETGQLDDDKTAYVRNLVSRIKFEDDYCRLRIGMILPQRS